MNFCEQDFDPLMYVLEHIPSEEDELEYYENKVRLCYLLDSLVYDNEDC